jgi:drug/metabolite transporter (DMT)-like permease
MPPKPESAAIGAVLVAGAALVWSSGGLLFRFIHGADEWTIVFWRALFMVAALAIILGVIDRGRIGRSFLRAGWRGFASGVCFGFMMTGYLLALGRTSVANTMLLMAVAPFFAALLAWIGLGERPRMAVWLTMAAAVAGVACMAAEDLGPSALLGNAIALAIALAAAMNIVVLRAAREVNMLPALVIGGTVSALVALPFAQHGGAGGVNLLLFFLLGVVQLGGGCILYIFGARHLPAAETTLIALLEGVLAPLWVWLILDELPTLFTLIGGGIVLAAVAALTLATARRHVAASGAALAAE